MVRKKDTTRLPPGDPLDGGRRNFFRMLFNPLTAAARGYELPANNTSENPPERKQVIRAGPGNRLLTQLIGPLAMGTPAAGGYALQGVQATARDISYSFAGQAGSVRVRLYALGEVEVSAGDSQTFSTRVDGDAPEDDCQAVLLDVLTEVRRRDRGQLWTEATMAPRSPGG